MSSSALRPALLFTAIAVALFGFMAGFAYPRLPRWYPGGEPANYHGPRWLEPWARFDSGWYRAIAEHGYYYRRGRAQSSVAFFPFYPLLMRALHDVFGGSTVAWGIPITFASGLVATVLFHRWCTERFCPTAALFGCAVLCLWPYAFFLFGAVYADALFLVLTLLAFSLQQANRPLLAGIAGGLAAATRPVGVAVVIGLIATSLDRRRPTTVRSHRDRELWVLTSFLGLLAYPIYLWSRFGHPLAFVVAEGAPGWDQRPTPTTWFKFAYLSRILQYRQHGLLYPLGLTLQLMLAIMLLIAALKTRDKVGHGYTAYAVCVLAIPLLASRDFQGIGRYSLAAFPAFGAIGDWLRRQSVFVRAATLLTSTALLGIMASAYARACYVA